MTAWKPIETAPRDRPILVRGGTVWEGRHGDLVRYIHDGVTVVTWLNIAQTERLGHWCADTSTYIEIIDPTEWAEIPE